MYTRASATFTLSFFAFSLSSSFLKYRWPTTFSSRFFFTFQTTKKKSSRESTMTVGQYIDDFFRRFSSDWIFFLVLLSRVSMIIQQGTNTPVLFDNDCRPSRTRRRKKNCAEEEKSTMNLTFHIQCIGRKKEKWTLYCNRHLFCQLSQYSYTMRGMGWPLVMFKQT